MGYSTRNLLNLLIFIIVLIAKVNSIPIKENSLVLRPLEKSTTKRIPRHTSNDRYIPKIKYLHVNCDISMRYANTTITNIIQNVAKTSKEVRFDVILPDTAFISGFIMKLDGIEYEAYVKEKKEAKAIYDEAVKAGQTGALVTEARDSNSFTVSINLESSKEAEFRLRYEELLMRKNGMYEMAININPRQLIDDMSIDVNIDEVNPISLVKVPLLSNINEVDDIETEYKSDNPFTTTVISEDRYSAKIHFAPSKAEQMELMTIFKEKRQKSDQVVNIEDGIYGQFVVQYNVNMDFKGQVLVNSGYFVHFFAPENLKPLNKYVIFVLDTSGSMADVKIDQLKSAMLSILDQLKPKDEFNIITFESDATVNDIQVRNLTNETHMPTKVTPENIASAKIMINKIEADGSTNMEQGLKLAFELIDFKYQNKSDAQVNTALTENHSNLPLIIFLSDGEANEGKEGQELINYVSQINKQRTPIFSLGFGSESDRNLLKKISLKNFGFMRPIYVGADASKQLANFFKTISSPLLSNVEYEYPKNQIDETTITEKKFYNFFSGSSMTVAGKLKSSHLHNDFPIKVSGESITGLVEIHSTVKQYENKIFPMERIWAYLTIKQLMDEKERNEEKAADIDKKALELALKYKFVTPVTSLVVVKPNSTQVTDPIEASTENEHVDFRAMLKSRKYSRNQLDSEPDWGDIAIESSITDSDESIQTSTDSEPSDPSPLLKLYGLEIFPWIEQYLNNNTKSITIPHDGQQKNFKLKYSLETFDASTNHTCSNPVENSDAGNCYYLTDCSSISEGFKTLAVYLNHFCVINNGYAGICC